MGGYLYRRLLLLVPTLLGITFIVFMAVRFLPGDVVTQLTGSYGAASPAFRKELQKQYSLDQNIPQQYLSWMGKLLRGDLGTSIISGRTVRSDLAQRLPITLELGVMAMVFSLCIALPVGILSAARQNTLWDYLARSASIALLSIPAFWAAELVITLGFRWFGWTPPIRYHGITEDFVQNIKTMWVPAVILGAGLSASVMRLTRSAMLDVLRQDYIRTAQAKGLRERAIIVRHALRNAIIPVITVIGLQIGVLVGGTVILEQIFSIPGMGSYLIDAINARDYPIVQGIVLIGASAVILSNLAVDVAYALIDPRITVT
jgi:peptide/nickel transport system permease protein